MKPSIEDINAQKAQKIEVLLEQILLDTTLTVLYALAERQSHIRKSLCYKTDCPMRDDIAF